MGERANPPWWAEASLAGVHLAVVVGFARLYDDGSFALPLVAVVLAAHALASTSRRLGLGALATIAVSGVSAVVVISWALLWSTTRWGLPTETTWTATADALTVARERFGVVVAPTEVLTGFQLASAAALWWAVWFADWTAFRLRATIEPVVPAAGIFIFCAVLGDGRDQVATAALFAATVLVFVATQRAVSAGRATTPAILRGAALVTVVAVAAGALVGPQLPGASEPAVIGWRDRGEDDPTRITISPMVELKRRLVEQSDVLAFEVRTSRPSYWRLTSLDSFDGEIWTSSGEYAEASGELESSVDPERRGESFDQEFRIQALSTIWVPSAYEAREVARSTEPLRWDDESGTLIVESTSPTSDGLTYTVRSEPPTVDPAVLASADEPSDRDLTQRYTKLPASFPEVVAEEALRVTTSARNPDGSLGRYEAARALQDWFRTFDYSLDSPPGHGDSALVSFLEDRVGYCEQFAGAFSAMARSLGIPARVAVGFTPGDADPNDPERYRVRGRHAHAWPEVHFDGIGWVPFEPTPQRGIPEAQDYTGVAPQQATITGEPPTPSTEVTTTTQATPATDETVPPASGDETVTRTEAPPGPDDGSNGSADRRWAILLGVGAVVGAVLWARRRRGARGRRQPELGADRVWSGVVATLEREGLGAPRRSETPTEYARRVRDRVGERAEPLRQLAGLVSQARWAPRPLGTQEQTELEDLAAQVSN